MGWKLNIFLFYESFFFDFLLVFVVEGGCGDCGWGAGDSEEIDCVTDVRGEISAPVSGSGECGDSAVCLAGERAVNAGKISGEWAARYIRVFQGQDGSASQECQRPVLQQVITLIHSLIKSCLEN